MNANVAIVTSTNSVYYSDETAGQFRVSVNSSMARGAAVLSCYMDYACTKPVHINLTTVDFFFPIKAAVNPLEFVGVTAISGMGAASVTPNDTEDLPGGATRGLYIGGAGNVKVDMFDGTTVTFNAMAVGVEHQISVKRVYANGTTATNIVALY
jgi:hypothetical protein